MDDDPEREGSVPKRDGRRGAPKLIDASGGEEMCNAEEGEIGDKDDDDDADEAAADDDDNGGEDNKDERGGDDDERGDVVWFVLLRSLFLFLAFSSVVVVVIVVDFVGVALDCKGMDKDGGVVCTRE